MTVGKDVSMLFPDLINCIQTDNLELKKLVYLYLINYAKTQPDLAILAVNTFVKDANDPNPLIRALAIRTMGCIRVEKIAEYLCEPLSRCLRDEDPYVRKTAAICVAKLFELTPDLVEDRGFLDTLRDLIGDPNPTVVSNAVAAIHEISITSGKEILGLSTAVLQKLLAALNECTEWGQVFILDTLCAYIPAKMQEVEGIIDRVSPRLQHANSAVVMSALKVILHFMEEVTDEEKLRNYNKKLAPPLVSLLNSEPEIQYVSLRNINLIVLKRPRILEHEIKVFFCKYNDPVYVKIEKLEIIIRLVSDRNVDQVLLELKEYATEVDVDFVRRAVRAIGRCAIKLEGAAERCITVLLDLIQTKVNYVVQEAIVVIKDIFRKYPNQYESIIGTLCENLDNLDEPDAKASMIWIIGEYAERIDNPDELLESFLDGFQEETATVQLQLLTATVKLFLKSPDTAQEMVQKVLNMATEESDNPDLRDRGYIYWRLLSSDPEAARAVILTEKPQIGDDQFEIEPNLLDDLISHVASLASIYHKPPETFVIRSNAFTNYEEEEEDEGLTEPSSADMLDYGSSAPSSSSSSSSQSKGKGSGSASKDGAGGVLLDLMGDEAPPPPLPASPAPSSPSSQSPTPSSIVNSSSSSIEKTLFVNADVGLGIFIQGAFIRHPNGELSIEMDIGNSSSTPCQALAIQFNKNQFGISPQSPNMKLANPIANGSSCPFFLPLIVNPQAANPQDASLTLQTAMKNMVTGSVFYFMIPIPMNSMLDPSPQMELAALGSTWKSVDESLEVSVIVNDLPSIAFDVIKQKLAAKNITFITQRDIPGQEGTVGLYFVSRVLTSNVSIITEVRLKATLTIAKITVRSQNKIVSDHVKNMAAKAIVQP